MEYIAPSKEFIEEGQGDLVDNGKIQGDDYESDETSVIDASRQILFQDNSAALQAKQQTDQDKSTGTSPSKISF